MPRVDDYIQAVELGRSDLKEKNPDLLARFANLRTERDKDGRTFFEIPFLNEVVRLGWPDMDFKLTNAGRELPVQQQVLILHYLQGAWSSKGAGITGEWIAFQDLPDGRFYLSSFQKRAKVPLVQAFGDRPEKLVEIAGAVYGAKPLAQGDFSVLIQVLPLVPVALVLWKGDEEFTPEGNILFDRNISGIFSAEDVAWLSGMVVYPLAGMAKGK